MLHKENIPVFPGLLLILMLGLLSSCATYYHQNIKFQEAYTSGNLEHASKLLEKNKKAAEDRNRLLYFMQKGVVLQMMGEYEQSNNYLEQAYIFTEDYRKNYGLEALSLVSNPMVKTYPGEDHEKVLIHYYKALNYLKLQQPSKALVEAKRLTNKLNFLNDKYENRPNRYADDAFAHILMGIAYEMDGDVNNAFIAYRNAYNVYQDSYSTDFGVTAPEQLKEDIMRTAYLTGFYEELRQYEKEFGREFHYQPKDNGELIFFWHNGLGPVKSEWSINFTVVKGDNAGFVTFVNEEYGMNFVFPVSSDQEGGNGFGDLKVVRVAFPKYISREPYFTSATLTLDSSAIYPLENAENIDAIAKSILQDRFFREMASALMRLAAKQAAEYAVRQENEDMGAAVSLLNALTEKADTRNWQTLPHSIYYSRVPLQQGANKVVLTTKTLKGEQEAVQFTFEGQKGETQFHIYHSLESMRIY